MDLLHEALSISRSIADLPLQIAILTNLGRVYSDLGEADKALEHLDQALKLSMAANDPQSQAMVHNNIGAIYNLIDEHQRALDHFGRAMATQGAGQNNRARSMTLTNLGSTYQALGEYEKALAGYQEVLAIVRASNYAPGIASALQNMAGVYIAMGEPRKALEVLNEALPIVRSGGHRALEIHVLGSLGAAHYDLGEPQKALAMYQQAVAISRELGLRREEAMALYEIGVVYASTGDGRNAMEQLNQSLALSRSIKSHAIEALVLYQIARTESDLDRLDEARAHIEAALAITDAIRAKVTGPELRASYAASKRDFHELYINTLMRLNRRRPSEGYDAAAFAASERARARSLLEMLAEARLDIRRGVNAPLLERERSLQQRVNARAEQLTRLLSGSHTEERASALKKELDSLLTEYQQSQARIRASNPRYAALTQPEHLSLSEVQRALDSETLLLEYSLGRQRSYLWAVSNTSITAYELPKRDEIEAAARRAHELLISSHKREFQTEAKVASAELSRMVLGPAAAQLGQKRLLIVADGALQYIPFGALPAPSEMSNMKSQISDKPLVVDHEIVSLPSASVLAALRQELSGRKPAPKSVAVLADPVFTSDDPRVIAAQAKGKTAPQKAAPQNTAPQNTAPQNKAANSAGVLARAAVERAAKESGVTALTRLRFTRQEAEAIAALFPGAKSLKAVNFAANRATATSAEMADYRIVHFATHVLLNSRHPELSGAVFSLVDERGNYVDGFLRLHEIYNLKLAADLVVLSACQTALGKEVKGEGLIGLTRGFMYAGAPRVVASLWSVDDRATAELMKRFYRAMGKGRTAAAALREAQVAMWSEEGWREPFYWGGFVLQGEWK